MPDAFTNARPYLDVTFPSSGDSFSISAFKNAFQALGFMDFIHLQPRAHNPANTSIMIRGQDSSSFYTPVYGSDFNSRLNYSSGDTPNFSAPSSNPRLDIVYLTPSGDLKIAQGTEASSPTLPTLAPSGDSRLPICAVYNRVGQSKIVNFEDKDSNTGDGYIYKDLRPFYRIQSIAIGSSTPLGVTGDNIIGTAATAARADHVHKGVNTIHAPGSGDMRGDVEIFGPRISQQNNRLILGGLIQFVESQNRTWISTTATIPVDDTIPQISEGLQILLVKIKPKDVNSMITVDVLVYGVRSTAGQIQVALFQDSGPDAVACTSHYMISDVASALNPFYIKHTQRAGTLNEITFSVNAGGDGGTFYLNGNTSGRLYGGAAYSCITVSEIGV